MSGTKSLGNVNRLDTKSFTDTISAYTNARTEFGNIITGVDTTTNTLVDRWRGKGSDAYQKDFQQVRLNLKDVSEIMDNISDALRTAHEEYMATDSALSNEFKS